MYTKNYIQWQVFALSLLFFVISMGALYYYFDPSRISEEPIHSHVPKHAGTRPDDPAPMARWPWPHAKKDNPHPGVTHYIDRSSPDGTVLELLDFDFNQNPNLRLELYDQDEDDLAPFDNKAEFKKRGVAQVTHHLNKVGRGRVLAAWNGLFFQYTGNTGSHVAPVVLNAKALYNVGIVRWTIGVKYQKDGPVFKVMRLPDFKTLSDEYDFAAEGASCLIHNGRTLRLHPFPKPNEDPFPPSIPPGPNEAGFVRRVDHIRTSRTSMAWSKDNRHFYLLIVKEPDSEVPSIRALRDRLPLMGGWTVADEQRFWKQFGVWCAVNIDGGDVTQMTMLRRDGRYDLVPARWGNTSMRLTFSPDFKNAPSGGSMMYFFVRDASEAKNANPSSQ
jgi:hypothetical protein